MLGDEFKLVKAKHIIYSSPSSVPDGPVALALEPALSLYESKGYNSYPKPRGGEETNTAGSIEEAGSREQRRKKTLP